MGWQEDLARTNDPWLRRPATTSKKSSSEKRAERKERNVYNETLRRAQSGDKSDYVKRQLGTYGLNLDTAKDASFRGSLPDLRETFKPVTAMFADFMGQGLGSFMESEKARVGGKFNAPLNVQPGGKAYNWLLKRIGKKKDKEDFEREVEKDNLSWTELNKYADDEYIGGGQLARGINEMNALDAGIASGEGAAILNDYVDAGLNEDGKGMIGDAAARIARAQAEGRAGFATPEMRQAAVFGAELPEAVSIETIPEEGWDEQFLFPPRSALSMQGQNFGRGIAPMSPEESEFQMLLSRDMDERRNARINAIDDFTITPPPPRDDYTHIPPDPTIDEIAGTSYEPINYTRVNPFREPFVPMEGRLPGDLPPFLSGGTDWWTPEPEEEDLRGWDWINEPVMKHYGGGRPSEEIERVWPNTPPPGYPHRGRFLKYLDQFGFNTGYDYYNE